MSHDNRGELSEPLYALYDFENMSLRSRSDIDTLIRGLIYILDSYGFRGQLAIEAVVGIFNSTRIEEEVRYALMSRGIPVFEAGSADPEAADEEIDRRIRHWFHRYQDGLVVVISSDHAYAETFALLSTHPNMSTLLLYDAAQVGTNLQYYQGTTREFRSVLENAASTPRLRYANIGLDSAEELLLQARRAGSLDLLLH